MKRADAGLHLKSVLQQEITGINGLCGRTTRPGHLGGFPLTSTIERALGTTVAALSFEGAPGTDMRIPAADLRDADPLGLVARLENRLHRLEERRAFALADAERARREIAHARETLGQSFPHAAQLAAAREHARRIDEQLQQMAEPQGSEQPDPNGITLTRPRWERQPNGSAGHGLGGQSATAMRHPPHRSEGAPRADGHHGEDRPRSGSASMRSSSLGRDLEAGE